MEVLDAPEEAQSCVRFRTPELCCMHFYAKDLAGYFLHQTDTSYVYNLLVEANSIINSYV